MILYAIIVQWIEYHVVAVKTLVRFQIMAVKKNNFQGLKKFFFFLKTRDFKEKNIENFLFPTFSLPKKVFFKNSLREKFIGKNLQKKIKKFNHFINEWHLILKKKTNISVKSKKHMIKIQKKLLKKLSKIKKKL